MAGSISSVWHYSNGSWESYAPGSGGTLTVVDRGQAYFVNATAPATFEAYGVQETSTQSGLMGQPPFSIPVYSGWNLLGLQGWCWDIRLPEFENQHHNRKLPLHGDLHV